jgi:hypothetical protein
VWAIAPANPMVPLMVMSLWTGNATMKDDMSRIPAPKFALMQKAAMEACDADDGVRDGIIGNPPTCGFDPAMLQCKGDDAPDCLTAPQVQAMREIYRGPRNPRTGEQIYPGLSVGAEAQMQALTTGQEPFPVATTFFRGPVFNDPTWNFRSYDYDRDVERAKAYASDALDVPPTGLDRFVAGNRKLLLSHGWADGLIPAQSTVNFYDALVRGTTCGSLWCRAWRTVQEALGRPRSISLAPSTVGSRPAGRRNGLSPPIRRLPLSARDRCARIHKWRSTRAPAAPTRNKISVAKRLRLRRGAFARPGEQALAVGRRHGARVRVRATVARTRAQHCDDVACFQRVARPALAHESVRTAELEGPIGPLLVAGGRPACPLLLDGVGAAGGSALADLGHGHVNPTVWILPIQFRDGTRCPNFLARIELRGERMMRSERQ